MAELEGAHDWTLRVLLQCAAEAEDGTLDLSPPPALLEDASSSWPSGQDDLSAKPPAMRAAHVAPEGATRVSWGAAPSPSTGLAGHSDGLDPASHPHPNPRVRFTGEAARGALRSSRLATTTDESTLAWQARTSGAGLDTGTAPAGSTESISPRARQPSSMGASAGSPTPAHERISDRGSPHPVTQFPAASGRAEPSSAWFASAGAASVQTDRQSMLTGRAEQRPAPLTPVERRAYLDMLIDKVHALLAAGRAAAHAAAREEAERVSSPGAGSGVGFALAPLSQVFRHRSEGAALGLGSGPRGWADLEHCLSTGQQDERGRPASQREPSQVASSPASCAVGAAQCRAGEVPSVQSAHPPATSETLTARYNDAMGRLDWLGEAGAVPGGVAESHGGAVHALLPLLVPAASKASANFNSGAAAFKAGSAAVVASGGDTERL